MTLCPILGISMWLQTHHRDDVCDAVARVDDGAGEGAVAGLPGRPGCGQCQHGLHGDIQPRHVERLEHDLSRVLAVLRRVEWRLGEQEVVVLRLRAQVLEDGLLPEPLHQVPVLHNAMPDRPLQKHIQTRSF